MLSYKAPSPALALPTAPQSTTGAGIGQTGAPAAAASAATVPAHCHIWLVTGPAGTGKSTLAEYLAESLHIPFVEGDKFHTPSNIAKMSAGVPLTDADRWDWLTALRDESIRRIDQGHRDVVLTCSALKRKYRDVIRVAPYFHAGIVLHFIYLHTPDPAVLRRRVAGRHDHYMGADMVQSQLDILEPPQRDETDVIMIDVGRPLDDVRADVLQRVQAVRRADEDAAAAAHAAAAAAAAQGQAEAEAHDEKA